MPGSTPEQTYEYDPATSKFDFNGATLIDDPRINKANPMGNMFTPPENRLVSYEMPDGSVVQYAPGTDTVTTYNPALSTFKYAGNTYEGIPYAQPEIYNNGQAYQLGPQDEQYWATKFQGQDVLLNTGLNYEYDPATGKAKDYGGGLGRDLRVYAPSKDGGFTDFMTNNGWMIPVAMATAGAGAAALGGEAAATGLGAGAAEGSTASTLPSLAWTAPEIGGGATGSTFGSLNAALPAAGSVGGAGAGMSAALPSGVMIGDGTLGTTIGATYMEAAPGQLALDSFGNAIPASSVGVGGYAPSGTSLTDALKTANQARQTLSAGSNLSKLLSGVAGMGSAGGQVARMSGQSVANPQQIASLLSGAQNTGYVGQIKGNQNPFLFTSPGQTQATEGTYDVSGSNLANALRKA